MDWNDWRHNDRLSRDAGRGDMMSIIANCVVQKWQQRHSVLHALQNLLHIRWAMSTLAPSECGQALWQPPQTEGRGRALCDCHGQLGEGQQLPLTSLRNSPLAPELPGMVSEAAPL